MSDEPLHNHSDSYQRLYSERYHGKDCTQNQGIKIRSHN